MRQIETGRPLVRQNVQTLKQEGDHSPAFPSSTRFVPKASPDGETNVVHSFPDQPERTLQIATVMPPELEAKLVALLSSYGNTFA